jgi:tetratricopeptide (TPR) repeat protein
LASTSGASEVKRPPRSPPLAGAAPAGIREAIELHRSGRLAEAVAAYQRMLAALPDEPQLLLGFGTLLLQAGELQRGLALLDRLLAVAPNHPVALSNRGNALRSLGRAAEALASYDRAIAAKPDYASAYYNRAALLQELRRFDEALRDYDRAIALSPQLADAHWNKALLHLVRGNYEDGWRLYEWRWQGPQKDEVRSFAQPLWLGREPLQGRRILLHAEAGLGDTIQFCRYAPLVSALGAQVALEVQAPLQSLLATLKGAHRLVRRGDPLPEFDLHCPLLSLPLALKTTVAAIPAAVPYLFADPQKVNDWRLRLGAAARPRVGLAWSGSALYSNDRERSMPAGLLAELLSLPVEFHVLQKEVRPDDLATLQRLGRVQWHGERLHEFSDTAALVELMDLVVSVDTSVAHLAGALGKEVWILLPFNPDHRWLLDRSDSPWYPTATLLRQSRPGDWPGVVTEAVRRLAAFAARHEPD